MEAEEYRGLDAVAIDELVGRGELSAEEVRLAAAAVHERTHATINAVVEWYDDPVPAAVHGVEGPGLRGVPLLRKDYGSAEAGRLVEMGSRLALGNRAAETARYVEKLWAAGAQILGRSAVPELIHHGTTESQLHGATRNPWDPSVSAGGSSGGAAAAVAAGVVPIAHASDCAGSIRIPAAACGLVGLKPGRGRVPWPAGDWGGIAQEFVVCRTVRDARRCLDLLGEGDYAPVPARLRIALSTDHWAGAPQDPTVVALTGKVAELLESVGHTVESVPIPVAYTDLQDSWVTAFLKFVRDEALVLSAATGRPIDRATTERMTMVAVDVVGSLSPELRTSSVEARHRAVRRLEGDLADFDVILTPTLARTTIPLDWVGGDVEPADYFARNDEVFPYNYVFNLAGWPSISVPAGQDTRGRPVGAQLSAPIGGEQLLLALAAHLEHARPWPLTAPHLDL